MAKMYRKEDNTINVLWYGVFVYCSFSYSLMMADSW